MIKKVSNSWSDTLSDTFLMLEDFKNYLKPQKRQSA